MITVYKLELYYDPGEDQKPFHEQTKYHQTFHTLPRYRDQITVGHKIYDVRDVYFDLMATQPDQQITIRASRIPNKPTWWKRVRG